MAHEHETLAPTDPASPGGDAAPHPAPVVPGQPAAPAQGRPAPYDRRSTPPVREVRKLVQKKRDAWWTVLLVDPLATPLVRLTARYTRITPNQITWAALVLGLGSAALFALGDWQWIVLGAVVYHFSFVLDCMDGKVARLTGRGSVFGAWLDYIFDRIRVAACAVALMWGQYHRTDNTLYIWLAVLVVFCDALRYINALETFKTRLTMRRQIKARMRAARKARNSEQVAFMEDLLRANPEADIEQDLNRAADTTAPTDPDEDGADEAPAATRSPYAYAAEERPGAAGAGRDALDLPGSEDLDEQDPTVKDPSGADLPGASGLSDEDTPPVRAKQVIDLQQEFRRKFPLYLRFRSALLRHRIRPHLVSGIEFQMGVFIVGPLFNVVLGATLVSAALMLVFELAIVYKLLLSTRDFGRTLESIPLPPPALAEEELARVADATGAAYPGEQAREEQTIAFGTQVPAQRGEREAPRSPDSPS
ncbi:MULTISPECIES: CDP-alcohol phosphatidyltransferase family protein [unclassified Streptomyces]|uniref:CDP-alcohol phosphatidyltransferase family protein n=1 Tax=unclassified Streptomyces TaxID=2593676 RepID=UPI003455465A